MEKPLQWLTLQELRDELERTRSAWETQFVALDQVLATGILQPSIADVQRHQMITNELLQRPSHD